MKRISLIKLTQGVRVSVWERVKDNVELNYRYQELSSIVSDIIWPIIDISEGELTWVD